MLGQDQKNHGRNHAVNRVVKVDGPKFAPVNAALHDAANQRLARLNDFVLVESGNLRKVAGLAHHQLGDARSAAGADPLPPDRHAISQHFGGRAFEGFKLIVPLPEAARDVLAHDGLEQFFLALEIKEQGALGNAGSDGHFFGARGGKAFFDEQVQRGVQQFAGACLFATLAFG